MNVRFGNLTVNQFIKKHNVEMDEENIKELELLRSDNAQNTPSGKFHIFDLPSTGFVVSRDISNRVIEILKIANDKRVFEGKVYVEEF